MESLIYLDSNGTTPMAVEVQQVISDALHSAWGNPSSCSDYGRAAKQVIDNARKQTALMIGAQPNEIIFMSGGTEANSTVLNSFTKIGDPAKLAGGGDESAKERCLPHIITSSIEHPSISKPLQKFSADGRAQVTFVEVNKTTHAVDVKEVIAAIKPNTVLVTVMLANNETG